MSPLALALTVVLAIPGLLLGVWLEERSYWRRAVND
jgi:hypothetical protein